MNPLFIKIGVGIGAGVLCSVALLLLLLLKDNKQPHMLHGGSISDFTTNLLCCICLEEIDNTTDNKKVFALSCKHKFHRQCLRTMLTLEGEYSTQHRCPYCRRRIDENVVSELMIVSEL